MDPVVIMIEFATLILGLAFGAQQIQLLVHEDVTTVEIYLDSEVAGRIEHPPWQVTIDLGEELAPHVLTAVALGASGTELDRVEQWINLYTQQTEVSILVSPGQGGLRLRAHVAWESVAEQVEPRTVSVELDGSPLKVEDPKQFDLPQVDLDQTHLLRVELWFSETLQAAGEVVFGGPLYSDRVNTELTATPVVLDGRKRLPPLEEIQDWFLETGEPLEVKAVEESQADIVIVRDLAMIGTLAGLRSPTRRARQGGYRAPSAIQDPPLKKSHTLRFISPQARQIERQGYRYQLFPPSEPFSHRDGTLLRLFASVVPRSLDSQEQRLADAVAVAGMAAARSGRRRVVLLIAGPEPEDRSQLTPMAVRRYLRRLRVPVIIWTPVRGVKEVASWGPAVDISSRQRLVVAYQDLSRLLKRQRIVWLEGLHLPQSISLSPEAEGIRLVE